MSDFIGVDVRGDVEALRLLKNLPREAQDAASDDIAKLMLNVVKTYPPYRYVTRAQAYPPSGWFSDKQRKFVMAAIRDGRITPGTPRRNQTFKNAWRIEDRGVNAFLVNETPYGAHLKDPRANHMKLIGWTTIVEDIEKHGPRIMKVADAAVKKAIAKLGGR